MKEQQEKYCEANEFNCRQPKTQRQLAYNSELRTGKRTLEKDTQAETPSPHQFTSLSLDWLPGLGSFPNEWHFHDREGKVWALIGLCLHLVDAQTPQTEQVETGSGWCPQSDPPPVKAAGAGDRHPRLMLV